MACCYRGLTCLGQDVLPKQRSGVQVRRILYCKHLEYAARRGQSRKTDSTRCRQLYLDPGSALSISRASFSDETV